MAGRNRICSCMSGARSSSFMICVSAGSRHPAEAGQCSFLRGSARPPQFCPHIFENTPNKVVASGTISLASRRHSRDEWSCKGTRMTNYPYSLFNKSPEQLRLLGARGGRAYGRNQRERRARMPTTLPASIPRLVAPGETAAQASSLLDAQFPWLRGAEKRRSWNQPLQSVPAAHRPGKGK
jgi:hypothetical protein